MSNTPHATIKNPARQPSDTCTLLVATEEALEKAGRSLAETIYGIPTVVGVSGELGAGKTVFVRGLARGLGVRGNIPSPSFALEHRYGNALTHVDLFRLTQKEAEVFMESVHREARVLAVEWPKRCSGLATDIDVSIEETDSLARSVTVRFSDTSIPSDRQIADWYDEVRLPAHIQRHMACVDRIAMDMAERVVRRGMIVRTQALSAAAKTHDLLRLCGSSHEEAGANFLIQHGYPIIGEIVRTHKGDETTRGGENDLRTIEQKILALADKHALEDNIVSIDERIDDLVVRYDGGHETEARRKQRAAMHALKRELLG